ncbi:DUF5665 domain-containing protein [Actibacterium sp. D379-3]
MTKIDPQPDRLTDEIAGLREEIRTFNQHRFVQVQNSFWRLLGYQFMRGVAMGLGTVVGATILVSVAAYFLAQIDFIPIIGDWAGIIAQEINHGQMEPVQ